MVVIDVCRNDYYYDYNVVSYTNTHKKVFKKRQTLDDFCNQSVLL